jgi:hypothetical protein
LRIRKKVALDELTFQALNVTRHFGSVDGSTLHSLFGIGLNLGHSLMQRLVARELLAYDEEASAPSLEEWDGFTFPDEQTKRHKQTIYDEPHTLTAEGERVVEVGSYEPVSLEDRDLYFLEPGGLMLPPSISLPDQLDWEGMDLEPTEIVEWFQGDEKSRRGIPEEIYGPVLADDDVLDDFLKVREVLKATTIQISIARPTSPGIWGMGFLGAPITNTPSKAEIIQEGYWYSNRFHPMPENPVEGPFIQLGSGMIGARWKVIPFNSKLKKGEITAAYVLDERLNLPLDVNDPRYDWLPREGYLPRNDVEAVDPEDDEARLRLEITPVPKVPLYENWAFKAMDRLEAVLPRKEVLTSEKLESMLIRIMELLGETWVVEGERDDFIDQMHYLFEVVHYMERQLEMGNWLIKYRIDEEEVFASAI